MGGYTYILPRGSSVPTLSIMPGNFFPGAIDRVGIACRGIYTVNSRILKATGRGFNNDCQKKPHFSVSPVIFS